MSTSFLVERFVKDMLPGFDVAGVDVKQDSRGVTWITISVCPSRKAIPDLTEHEAEIVCFAIQFAAMGLMVLGALEGFADMPRVHVELQQVESCD